MGFTLFHHYQIPLQCDCTSLYSYQQCMSVAGLPHLCRYFLLFVHIQVIVLSPTTKIRCVFHSLLSPLAILISLETAFRIQNFLNFFSCFYTPRILFPSLDYFISLPLSISQVISRNPNPVTYIFLLLYAYIRYRILKTHYQLKCHFN